MENYFVQVFGLVFLMLLILIMLYYCIAVVQKIIGRLKFFKEEVFNEYIELKADKIDKRNRIDKIKSKLIDKLEPKDKRVEG